MNGTMKCAVMLGIGEMEFIHKKIPVPGNNEVLVRLEYVGICGSDVHYFEAGRIGDFIVEPPFVLGHEASGIVVEIGQDVQNIKVGDRVALEPGKTCGTCRFCRTGRYNLCPDVEFFATPPFDGVFQEYVAHQESLCFKLPDEISTLEGAMIEPLAVGFHAANQAEAGPGQKAVVFGCGCIGIMTMLALKARGVNQIYMVDIIQKRLDKAMELGASGVVLGDREDLMEILNEMTEGEGFDIAIETAGKEITTNQAIESVCNGATVVLVGYDQTGMRHLKVGQALDKELTFKTVFRYRHIYPMAIEALEAGRLNLSDAVTNIFSFDDIQTAMSRSIQEKEDIIKSVIKF